MGSTLEALIVSAVMLVILESAMATVSASSGFFGHQHQLTEAAHVGQAVLEQLMLDFDTDADLTPGTHSAQYDGDANQVASGLYTVSWVVTPDTPFPKIRTIAMTLTWNERGVSRFTSFTTFRN